MVINRWIGDSPGSYPYIHPRNRLMHNTPDAASSLANLVDSQFRAALARRFASLSPAAGLLALGDWALHLAVSPGKCMELAQLAQHQGQELTAYALERMGSATDRKARHGVPCGRWRCPCVPGRMPSAPDPDAGPAAPAPCTCPAKRPDAAPSRQGRAGLPQGTVRRSGVRARRGTGNPPDSPVSLQRRGCCA